MKKQDIRPNTLVIHAKHKTIECIREICRLKLSDGSWVDGVIYHGNDMKTGNPTTFVRSIDSFLQDFELYK